MASLNLEIEKLLKDRGALKVGFVTRKTIVGGPPSANISYHLPEAQSAIVFALPLDREKIRAYLRKDTPNGRADHDQDNMETTLRAYKQANTVARFIKEKDFDAILIFPNLKYRKMNAIGILKAIPEISLRYLAVRSGVGSFGWSGNIGIKNFGTAMILGGVTTTAQLKPTEPVPPAESFCTKCKLCVEVCAFRMFDRKEEVTVTLGGIEFSYAKRIDALRCVIVCGGYPGLDKKEKWSTWSPARFPYPHTEKEVIKTFAQVFRFRPNVLVSGEYGGYHTSKIEDDPELVPYLKNNLETKNLIKSIKFTCGNCQLICRGNSRETEENYNILVNSGVVIRNRDGKTQVLASSDADKAKKLNYKQKASLKESFYGKTMKRKLLRLKFDKP